MAEFDGWSHGQLVREIRRMRREKQIRERRLQARPTHTDPVGYLDCDGNAWTNDLSGGADRYIHAGDAVLPLAKLREFHGPLRPLYAGPVEDNDG